jgi:hypothetical protein
VTLESSEGFWRVTGAPVWSPGYMCKVFCQSGSAAEGLEVLEVLEVLELVRMCWRELGRVRKYAIFIAKILCSQSPDVVPSQSAPSPRQIGHTVGQLPGE